MDPGKEEQEKEGKRDFPHGVLSHLEFLECQARARALQEEQRERLRERRHFLTSKLRELRQRRDRLRLQLAQSEAGKAGAAPDPREVLEWKVRNCRDLLQMFQLTAGAAPDPREVLEWKVRNCRDLLQMFQLTGVSARLSGRGACLSLHTAFQGSLMDEFQLEFQAFPEFRLRRHSIPPFIPLERLRREFLPRRPREFLELLLAHLNAFVARREQLRLAQEEFPEWFQAPPSGNSLWNLLSFRYRIPGEFPEFRARLRYRDPLGSLPTDTEVTGKGGIAVPPEHSELFRSLSLPRALRALSSLDPEKIWDWGAGGGK